MIKKGIYKVFCFVFGNLIGRLLYSPACFPKGRYFSSWKSVGWEWVLPDFWGRLFLNKNRGIPWPVSPLARVGKNIEFDIDGLNNFQSPGCYFQTWDAKITIGKGTYIAQGVGIITSNHDVYDLEKRSKIEDVVIGEQCWLGMNCVVLPGVHLGDGTIVGAGSVVSKSFEEGHCVIAGVPARKIKEL